MKAGPLNVLLVDDDKVDAMALKRSFRDLKIAHPVFETGNGIEALECLRGENGRARIPSPYVVLLDLNMPQMGGFEFLRELRRDRELRSALVFVMTTSAAADDRKRAYDLNVAGYVLKHRPGESFLESINKLAAYWRVIEYPN